MVLPIPCAILKGDFEDILSNITVHFWHFALQKGPILLKVEVSPLKNAWFAKFKRKNTFLGFVTVTLLFSKQGWFTPGNPELSAWWRSIFPSTNVILDTGQVQITGTCQAHEWKFLELSNSLFYIFFYLSKKGLQNEEMSTRVIASANWNLFAFSPLLKKGLQKEEMSTQVTARKKGICSYFSNLVKKGLQTEDMSQRLLL